MTTEIFQSQANIAKKWKAMITDLERQKVEGKTAGLPTGGFTRRITEIDAKLRKLLTVGMGIT